MKSKFVRCLGVVFLFQTMGFAQADLDVEGARRRYEQQKALADQAEGIFRTDEREFQRKHSAYLSEVAQEKRLQQSISDNERELESVQRRITSTEREIQRSEQNLRDQERTKGGLDTDVRHLEFELQRTQGDLRRAEQQLRRAEAELRTEQSRDPPDENRVRSLESQVRSAEGEVNRHEQQARSLESQIQNTRNQIQRLEASIASERSVISKSRTQLSQLNRHHQDRLIALQNTRDDLRNQQNTIRFAEQTMEFARTQMNRSKAEFDRQALLAQHALQNYQAVQANYTRERSRVIAQAQAQADQHAGAEAAERAPQPGTQAGLDTAKQSGLEAGAREAAVKVFNDGYRSGRSTPQQSAAAYKEGLQAGSEWAQRKAEAEDLPRGYNQALTTLLASPPPLEATLEIDTQQSPDAAQGSSQDSGLWLNATPRNVGSVSAPAFGLPADPAYRLPSLPTARFQVPAADRRHFRPPCAGLALAEFEPLCRQHYETSYQSKFAEHYSAVFRQHYTTAYNQHIQAEYDRALAQKFPAELQKGLASGARDQGTLDAFAQSLPTARQTQLAAGAAAWDQYLSTGHLIRVHSATAAESSGDGLFTPGENASVSLVVDNYGRKPMPTETLRAALVDSLGIEFATSETALPEVAAQTRASIQGVLRGRVLPNQAGAPVHTTAHILRGPGRVASLKAEATVHFPIEAVELTLASTPKVDQPVDGVLRFMNRLSESSEPTPLKATAVPAIATITASAAGASAAAQALELPAIAAGETFELPVQVTPGVWVGPNTDVLFHISTEDQGGIRGGITQLFPQRIPVSRAGSLLLFDTAGKPVPSSAFDVVAGGRLAFRVQFQFHGTTRVNGPFELRAQGKSDPGIRHTNNSTVGVNYGAASPGARYSPANLSYEIPASLKGKSGHVLVGLMENKRFIHVLQVRFNAR